MVAMIQIFLGIALVWSGFPMILDRLSVVGLAAAFIGLALCLKGLGRFLAWLAPAPPPSA